MWDQEPPKKDHAYMFDKAKSWRLNLQKTHYLHMSQQRHLSASQIMGTLPYKKCGRSSATFLNWTPIIYVMGV